jgi:AcrR family transcriptional regulator
MQTTDPFGPGKSPTEERILVAAAGLFSKLGYNGVSTRDIASAAEVNEVTVYRHYPRKRDLYLAVLTKEMGRVSLRGDLLTKIAHAPDASKALAVTFEVIATTVQRNPALLRLILYSSLELKPELDELLRQYLGEFVEVLARYLEPWIVRGELHCTNAKALIFALIAIVGLHEPIYRAFSTDGESTRTIFDSFAEMCLRVPSSEIDGSAAAGPAAAAEA